ncbi:MAG: tRNA (adenosine(37)-N6)-threonylcarbamoyltransferase complex dimerization subunit type 1 TsaB [Myxococcales bacterium]|nr:tRNA (adenosine(37)-N6)-threonylcarbamoyltransferase complex dimerization subunit type 1 TsaB [Myxococcales bacterium]
MTTLCIDTATEFGTVVVARDDDTLTSARWRSQGRHGEHLFGHIESALADAGIAREALSLIGVDIGPGRFTSLRVGLGTAKGLAFGLGLPLVGFSSLAVLARTIDGDRDCVRVPVMNGYRGDVFAAAYLIGDTAAEELTAPIFGSPDVVFGEIRERLGSRPRLVGGEGVRANANIIEAELGVRPDEVQMALQAPTPGAIATEVHYRFRTTGPSDLDSLEPNYLRPSDAKLPEQNQRPGPPS